MMFLGLFLGALSGFCIAILVSIGREHRDLTAKDIRSMAGSPIWVHKAGADTQCRVISFVKSGWVYFTDGGCLSLSTLNDKWKAVGMR